ncbi:hypothetical protein [uncultured Hydrogenophaga sp.]|uniref:hypothetical protein n=1 Tax=uncultured Hydrogenophaga sp. TaxID=199683 RepID=UPI00265FC96E|nr:hypothetical protein [uncultured Hydrogenophaga sp.]
MSTTATVSSAPLGLRQAAPASARPATAPRSIKARGLAALLLAGVVAAMVLVADHLVNTWADGHLFLAWVMLWVIVFAGFALFADTARTVARRTLAGLDQWAAARAQVRAEERLWDIARADPRVMAELVQARSRSEEVEPVVAAVVPVTPVVIAAPAAAQAAESVWEKIGRQRAARALAYRI